MAKEKVSLSSPWVLYYRKLQAFFEQDPDVEVKLEEQYKKQQLATFFVL